MTFPDDRPIPCSAFGKSNAEVWAAQRIEQISEDIGKLADKKIAAQEQRCKECGRATHIHSTNELTITPKQVERIALTFLANYPFGFDRPRHIVNDDMLTAMVKALMEGLRK